MTHTTLTTREGWGMTPDRLAAGPAARSQKLGASPDNGFWGWRHG
jgi:hypothetical protein